MKRMQRLYLYLSMLFSLMMLLKMKPSAWRIWLGGYLQETYLTLVLHSLQKSSQRMECPFWPVVKILSLDPGSLMTWIPLK
uniref:Pantothenate kinase n=1 Tax=Rhizophora mucronata TaxID=61149 RepID=A0A2P2J7H1_RHIMU